MIFITATFQVRPEFAEQWPALTAPFTAATRAEPGNLWFFWSRSTDDPLTYVLVEAFRDDAAEAHVTSAHFRQAQAELPAYLSATPKVVSTQIPQGDWSDLTEMAVDA